MCRLERPRHRRVCASAPLPKLGAQCDLLRERVLEGVLRHRVERLLVQEFAILQQLKRLGQIGVGPVQDRRQDRPGELPADHGRRLQGLLLAFAEPVDARCEHRLHRLWDFERLDRLDQAVRAARATEDPRLRQ